MGKHVYDLEININNAPDDNAVHEAVSFYWGERCSDFEPLCPVCRAWKQYDEMINLTFVREGESK
jgi:hypothetical protein